MSNPEHPPVTGAPLHEPDRPSIKLLVGFGFGLFVAIGIVLFFVGWSFWLYQHRVAGSQPAAPRLARTELPPQPRLQVNPQLDLRRMREQEDEHLNTYRWINRPLGRISIPIDRALDYVARNGLPEPQPAAGTQTQ
jgi:hypothetical protein